MYGLMWESVIYCRVIFPRYSMPFDVSIYISSLALEHIHPRLKVQRKKIALAFDRLSPQARYRRLCSFFAGTLKPRNKADACRRSHQ